jgi:hypothetical protein
MYENTFVGYFEEDLFNQNIHKEYMLWCYLFIVLFLRSDLTILPRLVLHSGTQVILLPLPPT